MQNIFCNFISFDIGVKCDVGMFLAGFMRFTLIVPWLLFEQAFEKCALLQRWCHSTNIFVHLHNTFG